MRAARRSAARTRARWAFWVLVGVNAVMLWFFVGMAASLGQHAEVLDRETLQLCAARALQGQQRSAWSAELGDVRFVDDATIRFAAVFDDVDPDGDVTSEVVRIECTVARGPDDDDGILVARAEVLR